MPHCLFGSDIYINSLFDGFMTTSIVTFMLFLKIQKAYPGVFRDVRMIHIVWKSPKMSHLSCSILAFSIIFCPNKMTCLVTLFDRKFQVFKKLVILAIFLHFQWTFVHSKCKRSSLRSQFWMRLFLWFSNTVNWNNFDFFRNAKPNDASKLLYVLRNE